MTHIHPTAVIGNNVKLAPGVKVGPYCVLDGDITIGEGSELKSHVVVGGHTAIGKRCKIYPFASLGHPPQDLKYKGEKSQLVIGDDNTIREYVTMNPGTESGGMLTKIGNHCLFMIGAHVAHDCKIGDHVILVNNATLGGHVEIGDYAIVGGLSAVHQFVRIGAHAMIGGMSGVEHDVIPYGSVMGERANLAGLNLVGLKRRGFDRDTIHALRNAYKLLFEDEAGTLVDRAEKIRKQYGSVQAVMDIIGFMSDKGSRSLCVPKMSPPTDQAA